MPSGHYCFLQLEKVKKIHTTESASLLVGSNGNANPSLNSSFCMSPVFYLVITRTKILISFKVIPGTRNFL